MSVILGRAWTTVHSSADQVYTFDLEGRPVSWFERGRVFKRSLRGEIFGRERVGGRRRRFRVPEKDAAALLAGVLESVAAVARRGPDLARHRVETITAWTPERLFAERSRFDAAYEPITILPPDEYLSIVVQATFGCSWNRCTFCSFYQDRAFRARTAPELETHVERVIELLGRGAGMRRSVFLADGNALVLAERRLLPLLEVVGRAFPGRPIDGFVDVFGGERRTPDSWRALRDGGLRRVHLGVETGHDPLLRWLDKPSGAGESLELVRTLKEVGLSVSVILMVGVGGARFGDAHLHATLDLVRRMPLARGDLVYLSPFHVREESEYARRARADGVEPLDAAAGASQYEALRDGIRAAHPPVPVSLYEIDEFVY